RNGPAVPDSFSRNPALRGMLPASFPVWDSYPPRQKKLFPGRQAVSQITESPYAWLPASHMLPPHFSDPQAYPEVLSSPPHLPEHEEIPHVHAFFLFDNNRSAGCGSLSPRTAGTLPVPFHSSSPLHKRQTWRY